MTSSIPIPCVTRYFYNFEETILTCNLSRSSIDRLEKKNEFPKRVKLTSKKVGFRASEIEEWCSGKRDWSVSNRGYTSAVINTKPQGGVR